MDRVRALRLHDEGGSVRSRIEDIELAPLGDGDVRIEVAYSAVNYKDALAVTGRGAIAKRFPIVAGVDLAGVVTESEDARFAVRDRVLACGGGMSETLDGAYMSLASVPGDVVVPLPDGLDLREAMLLGTAGFTAAQAILRLEACGQTAALGPIAVTGATGGVGSFAVDMLSARGYEVVAVTGKTEERAYLEALGASDVIDRNAFDGGKGPLGKGVWGGVVDNLGGELLAALIATTRPGGCVASIGLAASAKLPTTVLPFILRGVSLLGIDSVHVGAQRRREIWQRIGADLKPAHLDLVDAGEIGLDGLPAYCEKMLDGRTRGRLLVRLAP